MKRLQQTVCQLNRYLHSHLNVKDIFPEEIPHTRAFIMEDRESFLPYNSILQCSTENEAGEEVNKAKSH
jgi:hypothetical protein